MTGEQIIQEVARKTNSELILFFVLLLVALIVFFIPMYRMISKATSERQDKYIEREKGLLDIVSKNTEAISLLRATLESSGLITNASLERMQACVNEILQICRRERGERGKQECVNCLEKECAPGNDTVSYEDVTANDWYVLDTNNFNPIS